MLSALLNAIFIHSLADALKSAAAERQVEGMRLSATDQLLLLLYADYLQRLSDILTQHARQWRYEVNLEETEYMCFSRPGIFGTRQTSANASEIYS